MTAGVPGTGLGGLFYIVAGLLLPVRGTIRSVRRKIVAWDEVARLVGLALGVSVGIWATGWLLGWLLGPEARIFEVAAGMSAAMRAKSENILRWAAIAAGFVTLAFVLLAVQVARLVRRKR